MKNVMTQSDYEYREELKYWLKHFGFDSATCTKGDYYVYLAVDSGDNLVYVGSGKYGRWDHVCSGISHNKELNRLHFSGDRLRIIGLIDQVSKEDSLRFERATIRLMNPSANSKDKVQSSFVRNYGSVWNAYNAVLSKSQVEAILKA